MVSVVSVVVVVVFLVIDNNSRNYHREFMVDEDDGNLSTRTWRGPMVFTKNVGSCVSIRSVK